MKDCGVWIGKGPPFFQVLVLPNTCMCRGHRWRRWEITSAVHVHIFVYKIHRVTGPYIAEGVDDAGARSFGHLPLAQNAKYDLQPRTELCGFSSIFALFVCSVLSGHYAQHGLPGASQPTASFLGSRQSFVLIAQLIVACCMFCFFSKFDTLQRVSRAD